MKVLTAAAVLLMLTGCSKAEDETSSKRLDARFIDCQPLVVKQIHFSELNKRFPIIVGTNRDVESFVDSSQFKAHCLYSKMPEFADGMDYFEKRTSLDGREMYLFTPLGVTDILIGFSSEMRREVYIVGVL
jgi:hypothetical protein